MRALFLIKTHYIRIICLCLDTLSVDKYSLIITKYTLFETKYTLHVTKYASNLTIYK